MGALAASKNTYFNTWFRGGLSSVISHDGGTHGVREWDTQSGKLTSQTKIRHWIAFSPDGKFKLSRPDKLVIMTDRQSGKEIWKADPPDYPQSISFSGDGRTFVTWNEGNPDLVVWNTATGQPRLLEGDVNYHLRDAALTRDGRLVLISYGHDQLELRETATLNLVQKFSTHGTPIQWVALDPNGRWAAGTGESRSAWLWEVPSGREIRTMQVDFHSNWLRPSADGSKLLIFGYFPQVCDFARPVEGRALQPKVESARAALDRNPNDVAAIQTLGQWYALRRADDWAVTLLEKARAGGAKISSLELARCYWRLDKHPDARREFERALKEQEAPAEYLKLCISAVGGR
jgi:hypothetical protein